MFRRAVSFFAVLALCGAEANLFLLGQCFNFCVKQSVMPGRVLDKL